MHVFVTGATGFVGRALVQRLLGEGHEVTAWVRSPHLARQRLGPLVKLCPTDLPQPELAARLAEVDAVINLAGESVLGGAWTEARRRVLRSSRVELTSQLVAACRATARPPRTFISASAVGYYGDAGDQALGEDSPRGPGFLAELCGEWEAAALGAQAFGARVVLLRIGIVLGADGGALSAMLPLFRLGLGGPLGDGRQYVPFIHLADLLSVILFGLTDARVEGPVNCSAPEPVRSSELSKELGRAVGRPAFLPAPTFALRLVLGERAQVVLQSQRARPQKLRALGFGFRYAGLPEALAQCITRDAGVKIRRATAADRVDMPVAPGYVLEQHSRLRVPLAQAFGFFCRAENLGMITPSWMRFELLGEPPGTIAEGTQIQYRIALGPVPLRWRTIIRSWQPPGMFVDTQASGPYALWWHEHHLQADGDSTLMLDRVCYRPPLGLLGRIAHWLFVGRMLRGIFGYRGEAVGRLFGADGEAVQSP